MPDAPSAHPEPEGRHAAPGHGEPEPPDGVSYTHLDEPLFDGAAATKRELVEYLDSMSSRVLRGLEGRPLSVVRAHRGQEAFMQKNVPKYAPTWVPTVEFWAETSKRLVSYAICNDRRTLLWFANQRAVELHPALVYARAPDHMTHLVLDLDPPEDAPPGERAFKMAVTAAHLVHEVLAGAGLEGTVKTSGAKGLHIYVPIEDHSMEDVAAATRGLAARAHALGPDVTTTAFMKGERGGKVFIDATRVGGGATMVAAYSPRLRPNVPVSFPVPWGDLDGVAPADFTIRSAPGQLGDTDPWSARMPRRQALPADLIEEGHGISLGRVQAMHEGKRRARARRSRA